MKFAKILLSCSQSYSMQLFIQVSTAPTLIWKNLFLGA